MHCGQLSPRGQTMLEPLCPFKTAHCEQLSPRCGTPVPLYYCTLWAMIAKVLNPCAPFLLNTVGNDSQGVEPLCPFTSAYCRQLSPRCGTPVPLHYCTLWAMITSMWNPCAPLLQCTAGSNHPGVEPLCPFTTVHCRH